MVKENPKAQEVSDKDYMKARKGRVFIKNLPFDCDIGKLEKIFKKCGDVENSTFPKKNGNNELKGFGFIQFKHKNMALKAINHLNNKLVGDRRIEVSLAQAKKAYQNKIEPKVEGEGQDNKENKENKVKKNPKSENKKNTENQENTKTIENNENADKNEGNKENGEVEVKKKKNRNKKKKKSPVDEIQTVQAAIDEKRKEENISKNEKNPENEIKPRFDSSRTLFLQNINYSSTENDLFNFFKRFGAIVYAKVCKVNDVSKGTGFVMFSRPEDCDTVLETYDKCLKSNSELNPFEFDGKYIKVFRAYDKSDSSQIPKKKEDRRNRESLLFGLYNHFNGDLNDMDKEKREYLMKMKKDNFTNNPNLFTSNTRLTLRNFSKKLNEDGLRDIITKATNKYSKDKSIDLKKTKLIKQVKIIRDPDNNNKSKVSSSYIYILLIGNMFC